MLRVTTSSGVQVYKVNDIVKLDTKPIIYGKVLHFVKVAKKNDADKVVVERQPEEVSKIRGENVSMSYNGAVVVVIVVRLAFHLLRDSPSNACEI